MKQILKQLLRESFIYRFLKNKRSRQPETVVESQNMDILDAYVLKEPSDQNVLDIFDGQWSSCLPDEYDLVTKPGSARLFEDGRIIWTQELLGDFTGWDILELGPLEGGHSFMFQNRNVNKVVSVEANTHAFLKCLCIKEILGLDKVNYKLGDFMSFLRTDTSNYDLVFASGVLYHMEDPMELLDLMSKVGNNLFIWTHYYDEQILSQRDEFKQKFKPLKTLDYKGFSYQASTQSYHTALNWKGFCGGSQPDSKWLTRESIIGALKHFGFTEIHEGFDHIDHPNGPAFALCAKK